MGDRVRIDSGGLWEATAGYSRAIRVGDTICVAGTTASDPRGGAVGNNDIAAQTREVFRRINAALESAGGSMSDVVRTRMFVTDMSQSADVIAVHGEIFADIRPAATIVEVSALIDPTLLIEIEVDAIVDPAT